MPKSLFRRLAPLALALPLLARADAPPANSEIDAPLFYQLLIAELELQRGEAGVAFQVLLDAARRTGDEALYRRVVNVALQARAGGEALQAAKAWRQAHPGSREALQMQMQLLAALGQMVELPAPLLDWLQGFPEGQVRAQHLAALPRMLRQPKAFEAIEPGLAAERDRATASPARRALAASVIAELALREGNSALALNQLQDALRLDPAAQQPRWQALELMRHQVAAEALLQPAPDDPAFRLALARALARDQRSAEALSVFKTLALEQPEDATHGFAIGSLELDLRRPEPAREALNDYLKRLEALPDSATRVQARASALLLLAQAHEQLRDFPAATAALDGIADEQRALEVAYRRASLMARQGKLEQAREAARQLPGEGKDVERRRLLAEVQLLRDANRWPLAHEVLLKALEAEPDNTDLLYELAMSAEHLKRFDDMEKGLRRVIELDPRHHHARNALGYSLADRNQRLPEARELIETALELGGQEPALIDSLGWVAFREGQLEEAERLLRRAHKARPEVEISAHLAEVLWTRGERNEAAALLQDATRRDGANEVLRDTRRRLGLR